MNRFFVNYSKDRGCTASTFREPAGYANFGVLGFVYDIAAGHDHACLEGDMDRALAALEDGAALKPLCDEFGDETIQTIAEDIHGAIKEGMKS